MASRRGIVSAEAGKDLIAATAAINRAPAEIRRLIADTSRSQLSGAWAQELDKRPAFNGAQEKFVREGSRAIPFGSGITVRTGNPSFSRPFEFGTVNREFERTYVKKDGTKVTRRTRRQMPERRKAGWIAYPAANALGARAMRMWAQIAVKVTHDWMEGK